MAQSLSPPANAQGGPRSTQDARDAATAAVDADVQTHHRLLLCLEQSRRAQNQMVHDWMRDILGAARSLASGPERGQWLQASVALGWALWASALSAQGTTLAAWSEYQRSVLDQARASGDGSLHSWPFALTTPAEVLPGVGDGAEPQWLKDAMQTVENLTTAWTSAWASGNTQAASPH